jgi:ABC-type multidrug transport system ATPase subunit
VWGEAPPRKITAVAGPSGAGKTSLLNILSGRQSTKGRITVEYDIRLNNQEVKTTKMAYRKQIAFVAQDDSLPISATPRECIKFSAKLRLPASTTDSEIDQLTEVMLDELGLLKCADTVVGGPLLKGISGGERKRTSVGVELVTHPSCVFLDEPTSGLDSFSAVQLISVLKKVAESGASVLFTIHQPSSEVFETFDHFILMNYGKVMYQGSVKNVPEYFAQRGHNVPPNYNPADFIMNVAQRFPEDELKQMGYFPADLRKLPPAISRKSSVVSDANADIFHHVSMLTEMKLLYVRELKSMVRFTVPLKARFGFATFMSLLIGTIFLRVGSTDSSVPKNFQSHFGGVLIILMTNMFGTAMPSLLSFPLERPIFLREYSTGHYNVASYFFSKLTMEAVTTLAQVFVTTAITFFMMQLQQLYIRFVAIVFMLAMASTALGVMLGCLTENPGTAIEFLPILFVPQFLFAGFFIATDLIPPFIRWAQYLCSMLYSIRLAVFYEFGNCEYQTCQGLLAANDVKSEDLWWYWLVLVSLFVVFRLAALVFLRKRATQFF